MKKIFKFLPLFLALLLTITGCRISIYRFFYDSLDSLILYRFDKYFNINKKQEEFLKKRIKAHLQWHRDVELSRYIHTLQILHKQIKNGFSRDEVESSVRRINSYYYAIYTHILDDTVLFFMTLDNAQINYFEKEISKEIKKTEEELKKPLQERKEKNKQSLIKILEFLYGQFTRAQISIIEKYTEKISDISQLKLENDRKRKELLLSVLKLRKNKENLRKVLYTVLVKPEKLYTPGENKKLTDYYQKNIDTFLFINKNIITLTQRQHALKKIDDYIQIFQDIQAAE